MRRDVAWRGRWWLSVALAAACGGGAPDGDDPASADADADGVVDAEDCAPDDGARFPGAEDGFGDGVDQDCSGADGTDADGDGSPAGPDCEDGDAGIGPEVAEVHYDDIDQDCDGLADDDDADGDGKRATSQGGPDCDDADPRVVDEVNGVAMTIPANGATDVLIGSTLQIELTVPDPNATLTVVDQDGASVPGTLDIRNRILTFTPDGGWPTFATLTATLESYCTTETVGFSTSDLGLPIADRAALAGRAYWLDVRTGVVTQPPILQGLLLNSVNYGQMVQIDEVDGDGFSGWTWTVDDGVTAQDECAPTVDLPVPGDLSADPFVTFEPDATRFLGFRAPPGTSVFTGLMRPDGSEVVQGVWDIDLDLRVALGNENLANNFCRIYALAGLPCAACADGVTACWLIRFEEVEMTVSPWGLVRRTDEEIAADPVCQAP